VVEVGRAEPDTGGPTSGPGDEQRGLGTPAQAVALATLCVVLFLTFLDNTVVSAALASIQSDLKSGVQGLQWVVNGYALAFASLMLAFASLGDLVGRRRVMLAGVVVFCAGSVVCALAPGTNVLIAGRIVMGVGAAASEPGTLSVLRHVYPQRRTRADALGVWAAVSGLALALGPLIGGVLVGLADWRAIFWFNLAVGAVALVMALLFVPESADPSVGRFDWPGVVLGVTCLATVSAAVIQGEVSGYRAPGIIALFCVSGAAGLAFVVVERRRRNPLLNLHYFRRPAFLTANFVAFATYFGTFSIFFFTALYLEEVGTASPLRLALDFLPMAVAMIIASVVTGPWVARVGPRIPMTAGCVVAALGVFLTDHYLSPSVAYAPLAVSLAVAGLGFGAALVPVTSTPLSLVPPEHSGMAAGATNTSREMGAVIGVAVLGSLVNARLTGGLAVRLRAIGIPPKFTQLVISAVTGGGVPSGSATKSSNAGLQKTINEVISAAYHAFGDGLHVALVVSGILILVGALAAATALRWRGEIYEF
jgi:EmrB/QacA subfamily drug resistance transporter